MPKNNKIVSLNNFSHFSHETIIINFQLTSRVEDPVFQLPLCPGLHWFTIYSATELLNNSSVGHARIVDYARVFGNVDLK
jgi:hypothetical protein